jgi:hypothetical protein
MLPWPRHALLAGVPVLEIYEIFYTVLGAVFAGLICYAIAIGGPSRPR